ncbi:aminotransferase-like domain-containing protein [Pseudomonas vancouverensis]|uniref:PLP-dependent aminotransferase family protein n=1 Tax=Pseudomonas vancouverensis TaxID=95300 RepID=A0A1H2P8G6_PSEVA|nr:PLP-dependent aminotransferase family protein [Pseudomonas vancouverensis]KAB0500310.1 PLP-dependent aminotransferase family protein [Pseudomonas vancouverensis]TDB58946.1 PLP-dependent aminotransferase family protein [Pseudomonas vancouverensis]SDV13997.1 DNA-binding transcriptional regulator, MocR family, contains an aminotransferase domain [Pseudomonas vancouverensis]
MNTTPLYRQLANHYLDAIRSGTLKTGERFPSIRLMMEKHAVSLSTAVQVCRELEDYGVLEARPRSGNYIRQPDKPQKTSPIALVQPLDTGVYVGIHEQVSSVLKASQRALIKVNFASAYCAPELYPLKTLQDNMVKSLRHDSCLYGVAGSTNGNSALRSLLARRALTTKANLTAERIVITNGATEAINLALRAVTQPGDTVAVESPTFYGLLQILESLNLRVLEVPASAHTGINLNALQLLLQGPEKIKAMIVIPNLQNPLGSIMPDANKARLVKLCAEHDTVLIEDDTYGDLVDTEQPLSTLKHWDRSDNVIYCASLNKTLAPGMRLGWISAGRWHERVEMLKHTQSRGCEALSQLAVSAFMKTPSYERYLRRLRKTLTQQRQQMSEAITRHFPIGTSVTHPQGGTLLWVELPRRHSSMAFFHEALKVGIQISPGDIFSNAKRFNHFVRIGCGAPYSPKIDEAVQTLGRILKNQG